MLDDAPMDDFQIESFEPRHLKKARESLEKHLKAVEIHAKLNNEYKKGILKEPGFWDKLKKYFLSK